MFSHFPVEVSGQDVSFNFYCRDLRITTNLLHSQTQMRLTGIFFGCQSIKIWIWNSTAMCISRVNIPVALDNHQKSISTVFTGTVSLGFIDAGCLMWNIKYVQVPEWGAWKRCRLWGAWWGTQHSDPPEPGRRTSSPCTESSSQSPDRCGPRQSTGTWRGGKQNKCEHSGLNQRGLATIFDTEASLK